MVHARQTLFVLALFFFFFPSCKKKEPVVSPRQVVDSENSVPDLVMEKMHVQNYGENGVSWEMRSPLAKGYSKKNKMFAENLTVTLYNQNQPSTVITADTGTFNSGNAMAVSTFQISGVTLNPGDMFLQGHVVAVSTDGSKMLTDWVHFQRHWNLIVSTAPVQVIRTDSITNGIGMEATSDLSQVKIFHQTLVIKDRQR